MRAIYYRSFRSFSVATACEWGEDGGGHLNIHRPTFTHTLYPPEVQSEERRQLSTRVLGNQVRRKHEKKLF